MIFLLNVPPFPKQFWLEQWSAHVVENSPSLRVLQKQCRPLQLSIKSQKKIKIKEKKNLPKLLTEGVIDTRLKPQSHSQNRVTSIVFIVLLLTFSACHFVQG